MFDMCSIRSKQATPEIFTFSIHTTQKPQKNTNYCQIIIIKFYTFTFYQSHFDYFSLLNKKIYTYILIKHELGILK